MITKKMKKSEIKKTLMSLAKFYTELFNCPFIKLDMEASVRSWLRMHTAKDIIYGEHYFAIREKGVENGTKSHVVERCGVLGKPFCVIKVSGIFEEAQKWNDEAIVKIKTRDIIL